MRRLICALFVGCLFGCARDFSEQTITEFSAEPAIDGSSPTRISANFPAGTYLLEVRERGIDVRVVSTAGTTQSDLRDSVPRHGLHAHVFSLAAPGELAVEIRSADHRNNTGQVALKVSRWKRPADSASTERERGFAAFGAAGQFTAVGTQESWAKAAAALNESIAHFDAAGDRAARAQAQYTLGHLQYLERDDRPAAIRAAEAAADDYSSMDDGVGAQRAAMLRAASEIELASGMNPSAQRAEQRALYETADRRLAAAAEYFSRHELPLDAEYAVNMRGVRALYAGDQLRAAEFFAEAVDKASANRDDGERLKSLANLAYVHYQLGFVADAAREYAELLPLIELERQPVLYGALLNNYGLCLVALGEFDRALALHTEALEVYAAHGQEMERARQLVALGALYFRTGDLQRALDASLAAIEVQERIKDGPGQASAFRVAGNAAAALGRREPALNYLRRSAQIDVNPAGVARTQVLIAAQLRASGDLRGAELALAPALASSNALARAEALDERGRLRLARRDFAAASTDLRAADAQFASLGLDFNRIDTNTALSDALLAGGDAVGAASAASSAIAIVGTIRVNSANPEWRARFQSTRYLPFEASIAAELAMRKGDAAAAAWASFRIAEDVRARSLAELIESGSARGSQQPDPHIEALRAQLTAQQMRLEIRTSRTDADDAGTLALRRAIVETRARLDAEGLRRRVMAVHARVLPELPELQATLPADTAVLAYFVGDSSSHVWLLTRERLRHARLAGREEMEQTVDALMSEIRQSSPSSGRARHLASKVLGELLSGTTDRRLLVIPDGPLNALPFAALAVPGTASDALVVDRFVVGYAPSLALALRGTDARAGSGDRVAVISDPVYAPDDRRLASSNGGGVLRSRQIESRHRLTRLPYSALEAKAVVRALGDDVLQISGFDATPARVLELARLKVLHFATHAVARADSPEQSALFLSEFRADGSRLDDSQLTVGDITRSGLQADVVVLSGCETGEGSRLRGEGVLGLTYGFLANGSGSVVAALWPIEDAGTAKFMGEFYAAYRNSARPAEALRDAQLRTRGSATANVWSSFVVRANGFP